MPRLLSSLALGAALALPFAAADPAAAQNRFADMTDAERTAFGQEVRAYILENPEVVFEAIQILEQRRNEAAQVNDARMIEQHAEAIYDDGYSFVGGNPDGDITIVEFLDYRCGFCKRAHPEVKQVLEQDENIRWIVKEFPILGPDSVAAGRMALAALELDPGKYAELHDVLMSFKGQLTESLAYRMASEVGYDIEALKDAAKAPEIEEKIEQTYQLAQALEIQGTPSFIIGDQIVRGYIPANEILGAVMDARIASN